jgi:hypothetical protein
MCALVRDAAASAVIGAVIAMVAVWAVGLNSLT